MKKEGFNRNNTLEIEAFRLELATKEVIDLMNMFLELDIYVSMFTQGMSASLVMNDPLNLANNGPILGGERVFIRFKSPMYEDFTELNLRVSMQSERTPTSDQNSMLKLELVSESFYTSLMKRPSMGFQNQYSSAALKFFNSLKLPKSINVDQSAGIYPFVVPMTNNAIENLDWMASRAKTSDGLPFSFFEDMEFFNFASWSSILSQEPKVDLLMQTQMTEETIEKEFRNVVGLQANEHSKDALNFMSVGLSGRTDQMFDPINKTIEYKKNSGKESFDSRPSLGLGAVNLVDTDSDFYEFSSVKFDSSEKNSFKNSYLKYSMSSFSVTAVTAGDNRMRLGTIINLDIPAPQLQNQNEIMNERFYGGKFLVTSLKHSIRPSEYRLYWELSKESLTEKVT